MLHPIVAQMYPSPEQESPIVTRGRDVVVTAGAGTGKTRTLVARYLSLLAEGLPLRGILAITFTRKAAREMRNRVREEVRKYLERDDLTSGERARWQRLYAELDAARISTIHSLCTEILRAHPAEAAVDPRFVVLDEGRLNILLNQALDEAMAWAADEENVVKLFPLLGENRLRDTLSSMLAKRLDALACLTNTPQSLWPVWESAVVPTLQTFVDDGQVQTALGDLLALRGDGTLDRAQVAGDRLASPLRRLLTLWDEITLARQEEDWPAISQRLAPLRDEMKLVGVAANWQPAQPKAVIRELRGLYETRLGIWRSKGINLALDVQLAEAMPSLRRLFERALSTCRQLKTDLRALDFDDLEVEGLELLRHNPAVRQRWQAEIKSILVDEFQDTNHRQRELVRLLNGDGAKLFIVGDAKQSIYRFRGADVEVFRGERKAIESRGGVPYALETSYRAHSELVQGLNDLLRPVLGEEEDSDQPWREPFAPLGPHREAPGPGFSAPHIELHLAVGSKAGGALDRAASALAGRIEELIDQGVQIVERGQARPLGYGDIAILCRATRSFGAYEDALERAGVPYFTFAGRGFYDRPEVRDLLNALQALNDPGDDLALAGLLRSPAFALTDAALYHLIQTRRKQSEGEVSLWTVLRASANDLPGEDSRRAARAARLIAGLHAQVGRMLVADLLKSFLDATDYRAALIQAGDTRGARNVAKLLADAHTSGIVGVGEFLEYVTGLQDSGTREGEARATAAGAVQIMTVHAAKGLEFPVVVIGDATRSGGGGGSALFDPRLGMLLALKDNDKREACLYHLGRQREDALDAAESDRLLYVAATRAREKLIFSACVGLNKQGAFGNLAGWLGRITGEEGLGLVGTQIDYATDGARVHHLALSVGQTPVACAIYEPGYEWEYRPREIPPRAVVEGALPPPLLGPLLPGVELVDSAVAARDRLPPQRVWRVVPAVERPRAPAWVVGSLVHEALAAWRFPGDGSPPKEGGASQPEHCIARPAAGEGARTAEWMARWITARARSYGITDAQQLDDAVRQTLRLLRRFQAHPLYREIKEARRRLHEVPYSISVDGRVDSGVMDLLFRRDGAWTIVEFKTDYVKDRAAFETLLLQEDYLAQARRYIGAGERLLGQRPRLVLCMLNYAGRVYLHRVAAGGEKSNA